MSSDYIGKICPYCQAPLKSGADIVVCDECEQPHHRECWNFNSACTTYGCRGNAVSPSEIIHEDVPEDDIDSIITDEEDELEIEIPIDLGDSRFVYWDPDAVPAEIINWNWAAFLLSPLWVIAMRRWGWFWFFTCCVVVSWILHDVVMCGMGFYGFLVYLGCASYLGVKGNQLAWKTRRWRGADDFNRAQLKWSNFAVFLYVIPSMLVAGMWLLIIVTEGQQHLNL